MAKNYTLLIDLGQGLTLMPGTPTIAAWDSSSRPKTAKRGTLGFNTQTNHLEYFDGTDWLEASMTTA